MGGDLTDEERELLAAAPASPPRRGRPPRRIEEDAEPQAAPQPVEPATQAPAHQAGQRGPHTPAQFDDDGWNDLPVQMRG